MVITSSTAVDKNGSNPAIVRIWLPRHTIALRSSSRDDSVMNDWFRSLCDKVDEAKRATVSTVGSPTEVERHDASEDSVVSHPATPISASRQTTNAMPGSPYSAVSPSYVAGPPQAAGPVEWSAVTGSASASQSATSVSSNSSSKKSKEKGKSKDSSAAEGDPSYMRWFGMGRWKDNGNLTPLSVPDTSKHLPTVPETPRSKEETDQEKWRGVARRNKKERDETKGRTVDSRSFKNKLYGVAGMVSKDDSYIITRKPWSGSGESVASGEEGVGSAASAGPMSAPLVSPAETPVSPAGLYPLPATGSGSPTTISPVSQSRPVPAQQTPSYHRISNTMASAARGSSPTRHSVGGTTDLDGDPSPMTWAHRSVRREPSIMTATTGTSMPRRRKVIDSPVDNRHSIGDGRGSIAGDKRQSVLSDNRHSLATSNYSANHTIPEPAVGVDLDNLPPIPVWLRKCVALVDEMGLDQEGIYRVSGNSSTIVALKKLFAERGDEIELLLPANAQSPKSSEDLRSAVPPTTTISIPIRQRPPSYHRRSMSFSGTPHSIAPLQPTMPADPRLLYDNDIHVITGVIKSFLRDGFGPTKEPLVESRLYDRFLEVARMEDYRTRMIALQDLVHQMSADHFAMLKYIAEHLNRYVCTKSS